MSTLEDLKQRIRELTDERNELRREWNKLRSVLRCPQCGCRSITLTDVEIMWNCDDCKTRWPINAQAKEPTNVPQLAG